MTGVELVNADDSPLDLIIDVVPGCPVVRVNCTLGNAFCSIWSMRLLRRRSRSEALSLVMFDDRRRFDTALPCPVTTTSSRLWSRFDSHSSSSESISFWFSTSARAPRKASNAAAPRISFFCIFSLQVKCKLTQKTWSSLYGVQMSVFFLERHNCLTFFTLLPTSAHVPPAGLKPKKSQSQPSPLQISCQRVQSRGCCALREILLPG